MTSSGKRSWGYAMGGALLTAGALLIARIIFSTLSLTLDPGEKAQPNETFPRNEVNLGRGEAETSAEEIIPAQADTKTTRSESLMAWRERNPRWRVENDTVWATFATSDADVEALADFPGPIRRLNLTAGGAGQKGITDEGLHRLPRLNELNVLAIHQYPGVTDAGLTRLERFPSLRIIDLRRSRGVTGSALERLAELKTLKVLHLAGSGVSAPDRHAFKRKRPDVATEW